MKKIIAIIIICAAMLSHSKAQSYDTVADRVPSYYYSQWFDTCPNFFDSSSECCFQLTESGALTGEYYGIHDYTPEPLQAFGMSVMVSIDWVNECYHHNLTTSYKKDPEYMALYQVTPNDSLIKLAHVRWDTVTPRVLKLPKNADTATHGFQYCYVYEVLFDSAVTVNGNFCMAASTYNNTNYLDIYNHTPSLYAEVIILPYRSWLCRHTYHWKFSYGATEDGPWRTYTSAKVPYPPYHIITNTSELSVFTDDSTMGTVVGGGRFPTTFTRTIEAMPTHGHYFSHWDDGDTSNPRQVLLTHDTAFTAYFGEFDKLHAEITANYDAWGRAEGSGDYYGGDTVTITATPNDGFVFRYWNDGWMNNPRRFVITKDTAFKAMFGHQAGIDTPQEGAAAFALMPNPATGTVRCMVPEEGFAAGTLTLHDAAGKEVLRQKIARPGTHDIDISALPAGVYFATLSTPQGTSTRRLAVE